MSTRKYRKRSYIATSTTRVVYIDGIPIESTILDAGHGDGDGANDAASLAALDPEQLFNKYDKDGSGGIDFDEFKVLLTDLNIKLAEPKALAYFKKCDRTKRGAISFEEFRVALFACDPKNPNRTGGFAPGQSLSPKDLFEMFDKGEEGVLDRDGFAEVVEFMGIKLPLDRMEGLFSKYEDPELEALTYYQFKKVWLQIVDVRQELRNRSERFNRFLPTSTLMKKLEMIINLEEQSEARTLWEAAASLEEEQISAQRRFLIDEALLLARTLLSEALDAAGQVYLFGKGAFGRLDGDTVEPDFADFLDFDVVKTLWKERVHPQDPELLAIPPVYENPRNTAVNRAVSHSSSRKGRRASISRTRMGIVTSARAFQGRQVSLVTAFLWGKRIKAVCCGVSIAYAITDTGEVFCWGGNKRQWRYFYDDQTLPTNMTFSRDGRIYQNQGSTLKVQAPELDRPLTVRSEMMKQAIPSQVEENQKEHQQLLLREKYRRVYIKPEPLLLSEEEKAKRLALVGQYYELLEINPVKGIPPYKTLMETVEPELNVDDLGLSLELRGVHMAKQTRLDLMEKLGECLALELECLGEKFQMHMSDQDKLARRHRHDHHDTAVAQIIAHTNLLWNELRILQESIKKAEQEQRDKSESEYNIAREKIFQAKKRLQRQAREGVYDPRNFYLTGLTARGNPLKYYNGQHAVEMMAVGSRHVLAIKQSGMLYTWGVGSFGRLGIQTDESRDDVDAWHRDSAKPQTIPALESMRFRSVACGFGHSLALSTEGKLFTWGSATQGKLGIGQVDAKESFSIEPMLLHLPEPCNVRKIACGPSHSAILTTDGSLFVWGTGDGGKLGLGDGRDIGENQVPRNGGQLNMVDRPTRVVEPFKNEKLVEVSCGSAHTAVLTSVTTFTDGKMIGGRVYIAGSSHALGTLTPRFVLVANDEIKGVPMSKVSCGNAHTAVVSAQGELFTWGNNAGGCTGHPLAIPLVKAPTRVVCLHKIPENLCAQKGVVTAQSSQNASCQANYAISSDKNEFSQTQQEVCPFWQIELKGLSRVQRIHIEFRPPPSSVPDEDELAVLADLTERMESNRTSSAPSTRRPRTSSFKYVLFISVDPFDLEERGKYSVTKSKSQSTFITFSLPMGQLTYTWDVPVDTFGRYVRIQMENSTGMLTLSSVEVMGMAEHDYNGPQVGDVLCSEGLTIAIVRPLATAQMLQDRFRRAIRADRGSRWILEQLETYQPFIHDDTDLMTPCILCKPKEKCTICELEEATFGVTKDSRGRHMTRPLKREEKVAIKPLALEQICQQLLSISMRTEEEEAAAKEAMGLDVLDMASLEKQRAQEDGATQSNSVGVVVKEPRMLLRTLRQFFQLPKRTATKSNQNA